MDEQQIADLEADSEPMEPEVQEVLDEDRVEDDGPPELRIDALVEALVFASGEAIEPEKLCAITTLEMEEIERALKALQEKYSGEEYGFELIQVAGRFQFRTKADFASYIRELKADRPRRLSQPALETLAIVAYRQPVVRSDIEKIRGVDVIPTLKTLLDRGLIKIVGHQSTVGQPALYGTTEEFLKLFGLNSLSELPTLRDLCELGKDPGEGQAGEELREQPAAA